MSDTYEQHYLEELSGFVDRTGEVPPGLDDELAAALLIRVGRGDEIVRRYGDPRAVYDRLPKQLQESSADGLLDKPVRLKLKSGKRVAIKPHRSMRSHGSYAEKLQILEKVRGNESHLTVGAEPHDQVWIAMALRLQENAPRDFRSAWDKLDIVERLLVVEERQEAPSKFVKRPSRGRPRKHADSRIAAQDRERNRRERMNRELSAARKARPLVATLRELFHEAEDDGMTARIWTQFDAVIADLEKCMSCVQKLKRRNNLNRAA